MENKKIKIGTRKSKLALTQAGIIINSLKEKYPQYEYELVKIVTKGDRILDKTLDKIGGKGLFIKEIQNALIEHRIDIAVHSMKDIPGDEYTDLMIAAITKREDPRDVLITKTGQKLKELKEKANIGTSSLRRVVQIKAMREDIQCRPIRGNVETRIKKMITQDIDGVVLAAAGLKRLGLEKKITQAFETDAFIPSPGQGALGCEIRKNDVEILEMVKKINHKETYNCVIAEREFLKELNGSCHIPIGAYAYKDKNALKIIGFVSSLDGNQILKDFLVGSFNEYQEIGRKLAIKMIKKGAGDLINIQNC